METKRLYIRIRGEAGSRDYVEVEVVKSGSDSITVLVPDKKLNKRSHTELYRQTSDGSFICHMFRVDKRKKHRQGVLLYLSQVSGTKPAEMRRHIRIPAVGIRARFGDEEGCTVIDISDKGFSIVSREHVEVGSSVLVVLEYDGKSYTGTARAQSVRETEPGSYRYGMASIGSMGDPDELSMALPRIAMQVQLLTPDPVAD